MLRKGAMPLTKILSSVSVLNAAFVLKNAAPPCPTQAPPLSLSPKLSIYLVRKAKMSKKRVQMRKEFLIFE